MEIFVAEESGLCYGVKRALRIAKKTRETRGSNIYTFGDLIHNPQVISDLENRGIHSIDDLEKINSGTVIIRSHGVSPDIYTKLSEKNIETIDATCPIVKKIQQLVEKLAKKEEEIIIVGNKEHPEIQGLIGYSQGKGIIVENESQVKNLLPRKKRVVLVQSTQDLFLLKKVAASLIEITEELKIYNTICQFTQTRQNSTSELAAHVDVLFIIGGKNSSNTRKLYEISKRILPNTYFIENPDKITPAMLEGAEKIGLSGGASTPPEAIQEAVAKIKKSFTQQQYQREKIS
ncbi:MAG: 4-hydroxy-3-methylbut-2-enyl diphosphate reductase [Candidatus Aminicenantes bacterium]|nr:4-hydroxy-3-methylbut-2-enyl diphosphate reductase [Candidatus Aminicenantes bacterium]